MVGFVLSNTKDIRKYLRGGRRKKKMGLKP